MNEGKKDLMGRGTKREERDEQVQPGMDGEAKITKPEESVRTRTREKGTWWAKGTKEKKSNERIKPIVEGR